MRTQKSHLKVVLFVDLSSVNLEYLQDEFFFYKFNIKLYILELEIKTSELVS